MESLRYTLDKYDTDVEETNTYIGRQAVFDKKMNIVAYEMVHHNTIHEQANTIFQTNSTSKVVLDLFTKFGFSTLTSNKVTFINLRDNFPDYPDLSCLPLDKLVLEIHQDTVINNTVIDTLKNIKEQGSRLSLDHFVYTEKWEPLLAITDYIKVDISSIKKEDIQQCVNQLKQYNVKLIADKIKSEEDFYLLTTCGFDFFKGDFFEKPVIINEKTIASNKLTMLSLLAKLNNENIDVDNLVKSISSDVPLCYKMLKHLNSAYYSLERKIDSIHEAVTYVGTKKLKHWATIIALSTINDKPNGYMQLTLIRASMCENVAKLLGEKDTQLFFSVGLLSTLNTLLGLPMQQILDSLPLSKDIKNALLHHQGITGVVLNAVKSYEYGNWNKADQLTPDLSPRQLSDCFFQAVKETNNGMAWHV